jgi:hypothetical protein
MISKGLLLPNDAKIKDVGVRVWVIGTDLFPWAFITIGRRDQDGHLYESVNTDLSTSLKECDNE